MVLGELLTARNDVAARYARPPPTVDTLAPVKALPFRRPMQTVIILLVNSVTFLLPLDCHQVPSQTSVMLFWSAVRKIPGDFLHDVIQSTAARMRCGIGEGNGVEENCRIDNYISSEIGFFVDYFHQDECP